MKPLLDYIMNCHNYFYKMNWLDKLRELNELQKLNRRNRLEDKLKQQEYYGEIEELFDLLTETSNNTSEILQAHQTQTMEAISKTASRISEIVAQIGETSLRIEDNTNALKAWSSPPFNKAGSLSVCLSQY